MSSAACTCGLHNDRETACTCDGRYASAASLRRRFAVVCCRGCSCQVKPLEDEGWRCPCCGDISEDDARSLTVWAQVPIKEAS